MSRTCAPAMAGVELIGPPAAHSQPLRLLCMLCQSSLQKHTENSGQPSTRQVLHGHCFGPRPAGPCPKLARHFCCCPGRHFLERKSTNTKKVRWRCRYDEDPTLPPNVIKRAIVSFISEGKLRQGQLRAGRVHPTRAAYRIDPAVLPLWPQSPPVQQAQHRGRSAPIAPCALLPKLAAGQLCDEEKGLMCWQFVGDDAGDAPHSDSESGQDDRLPPYLDHRIAREYAGPADEAFRQAALAGPRGTGWAGRCAASGVGCSTLCPECSGNQGEHVVTAARSPAGTRVEICQASSILLACARPPPPPTPTPPPPHTHAHTHSAHTTNHPPTPSG